MWRRGGEKSREFLSCNEAISQVEREEERDPRGKPKETWRCCTGARAHLLAPTPPQSCASVIAYLRLQAPGVRADAVCWRLRLERGEMKWERRVGVNRRRVEQKGFGGQRRESQWRVSGGRESTHTKATWSLSALHGVSQLGLNCIDLRSSTSGMNVGECTFRPHAGREAPSLRCGSQARTSSRNWDAAQGLLSCSRELRWPWSSLVASWRHPGVSPAASETCSHLSRPPSSYSRRAPETGYFSSDPTDSSSLRVRTLPGEPLILQTRWSRLDAHYVHPIRSFDFGSPCS